MSQQRLDDSIDPVVLRVRQAGRPVSDKKHGYNSLSGRLASVEGRHLSTLGSNGHSIYIRTMIPCVPGPIRAKASKVEN